MPKILAAGGLGNQLFYWNLAHHIVCNEEAQVSIIYSKRNSSRNNELSVLSDFCSHKIKIKQSEWPFRWIRLIAKLDTHLSLVARFLTKISRIYATTLPSDTFEAGPRIPWLIIGYFQNPKLVIETQYLYFEELLAYTAKSQIIESKLQIPNPRTAVHIRRGDFIQNAATVGLLTMDYFKSNLEEEEELLILTDSLSGDETIMKNFPSAKIIGSEVTSTWDSFSILSNSQKLIASNSTFSWWAGLLILHRGGEVIVPNPWTKTDIYGKDYLASDFFTQAKAQFEPDSGEQS